MIKKLFYAGVWSSSLALTNVTNAIDFWNWQDDIQDGLKWTEDSADTAIQTVVGNAISFLYIVAVIYAIYGAFNILTAWGDEEKVKKWKTIIIQALIGLIVLWLANSIVEWLVSSILTEEGAGPAA